MKASAPADVPTCPKSRMRELLPWIFIVCGGVLRLAWPTDFEWKADEKWMYDAGIQIAHDHAPWPWRGMVSSVGTYNPGFSVWPFGLLAFFLQTPAAMTLGVMILNTLALAGFALWVRLAWPAEHRPLGYWSIALFAVSPFPVLFSRKVWAQDLLPVIGLPWLWGHSRRERGPWSFLWGLAGAYLGQLHMSGFFAAAGLVLATAFLERKNTRWMPWLAGSILGTIPLLPWLAYLLGGGIGERSERAASLDFVYWGWNYIWGFGLDYSLGEDYGPFMAGPDLFGARTGLVRWAHLCLGAIVLYLPILVWKDRREMSLPAHLRTLFGSILLGGLLLMGMCIWIHPFYLIAWSPLLHAAATWILYRRPRLLVLATCLQAFVTFAFLLHIHRHEGAKGDFGVTYQAQLELHGRKKPD